MNGAIEALYIFDELNTPIVEHTYRGRPPAARPLLSLFLSRPAPRASLVYLPEASPPVSVFSISQSNLLFLVPSSSEIEPLLVLEFLHRVTDVLEEFIGAPLLASKIQGNYDVVAQLLNEVCDSGIVCNTEPNALQEVVETPSWMGKFLSGVGLPGSSPALGPSKTLTPSLTSIPKASTASNDPAIPWRRPGVRHTSNELYVDIIESMSITIAPSGRVISALVNGTIAFTAKISGVPDLVLLLSAPGGQSSLSHKIELPVFHPCVRLARWRENPGELSFVPPDGRFVLAGYEVDLLPFEAEEDKPPSHMEKLFLPAIVDLQKSLGSNGNEFEVRLTLNTDFPGATSTSSKGGGGGSGGGSSLPGRGSGTSTPSFLGVGNIGGGSSSTSSPNLDEVVVTVPIPSTVRNITDMQPSRGEAHFTPGSSVLEWRVPTKDAGTISGTATLRCTAVGKQPAEENNVATFDGSNGVEEGGEESAGPAQRTNLLQGYYDESLAPNRSYQEASTSQNTPASARLDETAGSSSKAGRKAQLNASLMPSSVSVSFAVRGWLPSGIRVDKLIVDPRRSRGLGEGVKPYKGVKYICLSRNGVERRC